MNVDVTLRLTLGSAPPTGSTLATLSLPPHDAIPFETGSEPRLLTTVGVSLLSGGPSGGTDAELSAFGLSRSSISASIGSALVNDSNGLAKSLLALASNLDSSVIGPLTKLLGIRVGGADVYAVDAVCSVPALRG